MDIKRIRETQAIEPQKWQRGIVISWENLSKDLTNPLKPDIIQYVKETKPNRTRFTNPKVS